MVVKKKSLPWAGIKIYHDNYAGHIGAYNPTETTELIKLIRKIAAPQKAHNCQIVQNFLPFVNM
jgi:hypothetical protein